MSVLKKIIPITIFLSVLTLLSFSQPIEKHLIGNQISAQLKGVPLDHYWSKCVSAGRANEGLTSFVARTTRYGSQIMWLRICPLSWFVSRRYVCLYCR